MTTNIESCGIMQPYFMPYAGYFSLIKATKKWIVFDKTQYKKQSWGNRNRMLIHPSGLDWFTIPLIKHSRNAYYSDIKINYQNNWEEKFLRQLEYYKLNAPFYNEVIVLLKTLFDKHYEYLCDLNIEAMRIICEYLDISFQYSKFSEIDFSVDKVRHSGDWGLQICKKVNMKRYINPSLGYFMFKEEEWIEEGIDLKFLLFTDTPYNQCKDTFDDKLSILDVIMWNSKEETHKILDNYQLLTHKEITLLNK